MSADCPTCGLSGDYRIGKPDRDVYDCETNHCPVELFVVEVSRS